MPAGGEQAREEEARAVAMDLEGVLVWRVFRSRTAGVWSSMKSHIRSLGKGDMHVFICSIS